MIGKYLFSIKKNKITDNTLQDNQGLCFSRVQSLNLILGYLQNPQFHGGFHVY